MWFDTPFTRRLGLAYPIVQGPFGGGLSSPLLAATVSNLGGLGSYGAQGMAPERIPEVIGEIRARTDRPFAVNLWVSTEDDGAFTVDEARWTEARAALEPFFAELGLPLPAFEPRTWPRFEDQVEALLAARPAVFSFVFGIPPAAALEACRKRGIITLGAATTVAEALALEHAGVDAVVASGFEAGGHRPSFLDTAERSLAGTLSLVSQVVEAVRIPVVAAGGLADGRAVAAVLTLGAAAAQIGTAFLACEESNALPEHRAALFAASGNPTTLTRAFSGRLARGLRNAVSEHLASLGTAVLPYPRQSHLVSTLKDEALRQGRPDLVAMWGGQSTPLLRHHHAAELFRDLVAGAEAAVSARA